MKQKIPDYYPTMFLDGYEPWEILAAAHKKMIAAAGKQSLDLVFPRRCPMCGRCDQRCRRRWRMCFR